MHIKAAAPCEKMQRQFRPNSIEIRKEVSMRRTLRTCLLVLTLTTSAHAGVMQGGTPEPPPPQPAASTPPDNTITGGEMQGGQPETVTEVMIALLSGVMTLL